MKSILKTSQRKYTGNLLRIYKCICISFLLPSFLSFLRFSFILSVCVVVVLWMGRRVTGCCSAGGWYSHTLTPKMSHWIFFWNFIINKVPPLTRALPEILIIFSFFFHFYSSLKAPSGNVNKSIVLYCM